MDVLDADFVAGATAFEQLPAPTYAEVAFAGRSNVGKSSLINSLLARRKLVRTSSDPGCTRAINIFRVRLRHDDDEAYLHLVDLPGYGYARRGKAERRSWGPLVESFLRRRPGLRAVVVILDVRRGFEADDGQLIEFLQSVDLEPIVVATKLDKLPASKRKPALSALRRDVGQSVIGYSAVNQEGREALWRQLLRAGAIASAEKPLQR